MEAIITQMKGYFIMNLTLVYLLTINLLTFFSFILDKKRSRKGQWRISEKQLLFLSLIGGSLGGFVAMVLARHKTKKLKFIVGVPLLLLVNIYVFYQVITRYIL